jgi:hypothetical protein
MTPKQYDALLRLAGLRAALKCIQDEIDKAEQEALLDVPLVTGGGEIGGRMSERGRAAISRAQQLRWRRVRGELEPLPPMAELEGSTSPRSAAWTDEKRAEQSRKMKELIEQKRREAEFSGELGGKDDSENPEPPDE